MTQPAFKYTFPIAKAEARADGNYIIGYASGPEVDTEGERMAPEAIQRFSDQINASSDGMRLTYRDAHAPDGVLRDLGDITKAWVTDQFHLGVEVRLDTDNPAADFLFKSINKGKQYGMSVAGHVVDFAYEHVAEIGKSVLTYKNVVLDEISNTTRPAWYPSFGTVLAKSIKDASEAGASGDTAMGNKTDSELLDQNVEDAEKSDTTDEVVEDTTEKTADDAASESNDDSTEKADESEDADVEKAGRKVSGATANKLLGLFTEMQTALTDLGVIEDTNTDSEKSASDSEEDTVEKTDDADATADVITKSQFNALVTELQKANERIAELEKLPGTESPGVVIDKSDKELEDILAKASPSERLAIAFAAHTSGK